MTGTTITLKGSSRVGNSLYVYVKEGRSFIDMLLMEKEQNSMSNCFTNSSVGARGVRKERATPFPTALTHLEIRSVDSD